MSNNCIMQNTDNQIVNWGAKNRSRFDEDINGSANLYVSFSHPCSSL